MEQGTRVFEGPSRQGKSILIRSLQQNDAEALCCYINALSSERTFVRFQGEQVSLEGERAYITSQLQRIEKQQAVQAASAGYYA
jgi:hypothetical protein